MEHEAGCPHKPAQPPARRRRKQPEDGEAEEEAEEAEEESDEDEEEEEEEEIEIEDVFLSNFAFILVLLRAYILEFVDYDEEMKQPDKLNLEYLLVFLLCAWLYHSWQENGHLLLDETSPFMAIWFLAILLPVMVTKVSYAPWAAAPSMAEYKLLVAGLKPAVTLLTGLFSCSVHCYVHDMWREDNVFILSCVMVLSLLLSAMETFWSMQVTLSSINSVVGGSVSMFKSTLNQDLKPNVKN